MKRVLIKVEKGIATLVAAPPDVEVVIRDYDEGQKVGYCFTLIESRTDEWVCEIWMPTPDLEAAARAMIKQCKIEGVAGRHLTLERINHEPKDGDPFAVLGGQRRTYFLSLTEINPAFSQQEINQSENPSAA